MVQLSFGVSTMMVLLISSWWKALWAIKAFVRLFTCMCPLVHHQVRQTSKLSLTHLLCISFWAYLVIYRISVIKSTYLWVILYSLNVRLFSQIKMSNIFLIYWLLILPLYCFFFFIMNVHTNFSLLNKFKRWIFRRNKKGFLNKYYLPILLVENNFRSSLWHQRSKLSSN